MNIVVIVKLGHHFADLEAVGIKFVFYKIEWDQEDVRDLYNDLFM